MQQINETYQYLHSAIQITKFLNNCTMAWSIIMLTLCNIWLKLWYPWVLANIYTSLSYNVTETRFKHSTTSVTWRGLGICPFGLSERGWTGETPVQVHSSRPVVRRPDALVQGREGTSPRLRSHRRLLGPDDGFNRESVAGSLSSRLCGFCYSWRERDGTQRRRRRSRQGQQRRRRQVTRQGQQRRVRFSRQHRHHRVRMLQRRRRPLIPLPPPQETPIVKHILRQRIQGPVVSFPRIPRLPRYFDEAVVQTQIMPNRVLPSGELFSVVRKPGHDELTDTTER